MTFLFLKTETVLVKIRGLAAKFWAKKRQLAAEEARATRI